MQGRPNRLTRAEQKARTRDRLLVAARRVIARRGLGAASVDEISDDAGFSSGAFYSNFASKDEVFAAALTYHAAELERDGQTLSQLDEGRALFWLEIVVHGSRSQTLRPLVREHLATRREALSREAAGGSGAMTATDSATLLLAAEIGLSVQRLYDDVEPGLLETLAEALGDGAGPRGKRGPA